MYYNSLNSYLRSEFGCKVYKLALQGGSTCPNRDGTVGTGGCIFCRGGSGDFTAYNDDVRKEIEAAKLKVKNKIQNGKYIAYFQSYSATYGDIERQKERFFSAINEPSIAALSIATRPDCLEKKVLDILSELNLIKPVWVELGLQTIHESTAQYIRRGFDLECYTDAVAELHKRNIDVVTHMIIGLPFETEQMIYDTAAFIGNMHSEGIKFHLLHVLSGTDLETEYKSGIFTLPTLEEYTRLLIGCIRRIPESTVIYRLTGDGNKNYLTAPKWSADKKRVLNYITNEFKKQNLIQGDLIKNKNSGVLEFW